MLICHLGCSRDEVDTEGDVEGISREGVGSQVESVVLLKIQHLGRSTIIVIIFITFIILKRLLWPCGIGWERISKTWLLLLGLCCTSQRKEFLSELTSYIFLPGWMMLTTMVIVVVDISAEFSIVANFILFVCVINLASRQCIAMTGLWQRYGGRAPFCS